VEGERWRARTEDGQSVPSGAEVVVRRVEGLQLWVAPKNEER
jgi:membrane protein implicated in regulation of membrane protease activity